METKKLLDFGERSIAQRIATGLGKIGLALRSRAWLGATEEGLTPTQGQILITLCGTPSRPRAMTLSEIATALAVTRATVSDSVDALEAKQLIRKVRDRLDSRIVRAELTPHGRRVASRVALWSDFLLRAVDVLDPVEQKVFLGGIIKMIRSLQERGEIPVSRMCVTCRFFRPYAYPNSLRPHHCAFVDAPFGDAHLQLDCPDHEPASPEAASAIWSSFLNARP
jgi:DNA-binding MarR family transcriptional regulator